MGVKETLLERTTGPYLAAVLKLMAFTFNRDAGLKSQLYRRRNGTVEPFDTRYQFRTANGATNLYLTIENGRMRAGFGPSGTPTTTRRSATPLPCVPSFRPSRRPTPST